MGDIEKFRVSDDEKGKKNAFVFRADDVYEEMLAGFRNGKIKGTTTYNTDIDQCWTWRKEEANIWTGYANEGKALDIQTLIPTPYGYYRLADLRVGDEVFDENGNICKITKKTDVMHNHDCYELLFSDGVRIVADKDHQWVVDDIQSRASKARQKNRGTETKKRGTNQQHKALTSKVLTTEQMFLSQKVGTKANYSIPLAKPLNYPKKELPIDPYILGVWLGDGSSSSGEVTSADTEIIDAIRNLGYEVRKSSSKYHYYVQSLITDLRALNLFKNKHIPFEYLTSSVDDRLELLRGLMDTDGYTDKLGRCEYVSVRYELAEHVKLLVTSLGIKVYITEDDAKLYGKFISKRYRIRFKTDLSVFKLTRKKIIQESAKSPKNSWRLIKSITKVSSVPVQCIEVDSPSHLFLCTEDCIPTHNSIWLKQLCLIKALKEDWRFVFCSPEDFPAEEFYDDMIHTLVGKSTDRDRAITREICSEEEYHRAYELIKDKFIFLYIEPPHNTIKGTLEEFKKIMATERIDGCVIDPLLKFARPKGMQDVRDDIYASYIGSVCTDFARRTKSSLHLVMHQVTPMLDRDTKKYPEPSMYRIKGGGSWSDGFDNILSIWRPNYASNKLDTEVQFSSQKIKKQKLVGLPQRVVMNFDRITNRYKNINTGMDIFDFDEIMGVERKKQIAPIQQDDSFI